jgi:hypothetical protein
LNSWYFVSSFASFEKFCSVEFDIRFVVPSFAIESIKTAYNNQVKQKKMIENQFQIIINWKGIETKAKFEKQKWKINQILKFKDDFRVDWRLQWRIRVSIPLPSACKADALPCELIPQFMSVDSTKEKAEAEFNQDLNNFMLTFEFEIQFKLKWFVSIDWLIKLCLS